MVLLFPKKEKIVDRSMGIEIRSMDWKRREDSGVSPEHPYVSNVVGGVEIGFDAHGDVVYNKDDYFPETLWSHGQVCAGLISHLCIILPVAL